MPFRRVSSERSLFPHRVRWFENELQPNISSSGNSDKTAAAAALESATAADVACHSSGPAVHEFTSCKRRSSSSSSSADLSCKASGSSRVSTLTAPTLFRAVSRMFPGGGNNKSSMPIQKSHEQLQQQQQYKQQPDFGTSKQPVPTDAGLLSADVLGQRAHAFLTDKIHEEATSDPVAVVAVKQRVDSASPALQAQQQRVSEVKSSCTRYEEGQSAQTQQRHEVTAEAVAAGGLQMLQQQEQQRDAYKSQGGGEWERDKLMMSENNDYAWLGSKGSSYGSAGSSTNCLSSRGEASGVSNIGSYNSGLSSVDLSGSDDECTIRRGKNRTVVAEGTTIMPSSPTENSGMQSSICFVQEFPSMPHFPWLDPPTRHSSRKDPNEDLSVPGGLSHGILSVNTAVSDSSRGDADVADFVAATAGLGVDGAATALPESSAEVDSITAAAPAHVTRNDEPDRFGRTRKNIARCQTLPVFDISSSFDSHIFPDGTNLSQSNLFQRLLRRRCRRRRSLTRIAAENGADITATGPRMAAASHPVISIDRKYPRTSIMRLQRDHAAPSSHTFRHRLRRTTPVSDTPPGREPLTSSSTEQECSNQSEVSDAVSHGSSRMKNVRFGTACVHVYTPEARINSKRVFDFALPLHGLRAGWDDSVLLPHSRLSALLDQDTDEEGFSDDAFSDEDLRGGNYQTLLGSPLAAVATKGADALRSNFRQTLVAAATGAPTGSNTDCSREIEAACLQNTKEIDNKEADDESLEELEDFPSAAIPSTAQSIVAQPRFPRQRNLADLLKGSPPMSRVSSLINRSVLSELPLLQLPHRKVNDSAVELGGKVGSIKGGEEQRIVGAEGSEDDRERGLRSLLRRLATSRTAATSTPTATERMVSHSASPKREVDWDPPPAIVAQWGCALPTQPEVLAATPEKSAVEAVQKAAASVNIGAAAGEAEGLDNIVVDSHALLRRKVNDKGIPQNYASENIATTSIYSGSRERVDEQAQRQQESDCISEDGDWKKEANFSESRKHLLMSHNSEEIGKEKNCLRDDISQLREEPAPLAVGGSVLKREVSKTVKDFQLDEAMPAFHKMLNSGIDSAQENRLSQSNTSIFSNSSIADSLLFDPQLRQDGSNAASDISNRSLNVSREYAASAKEKFGVPAARDPHTELPHSPNRVAARSSSVRRGLSANLVGDDIVEHAAKQVLGKSSTLLSDKDKEDFSDIVRGWCT